MDSNTSPTDPVAVRQFPASRPAKLTYVAGIILFFVFGAFVLSQDPTAGTQQAGKGTAATAQTTTPQK